MPDKRLKRPRIYTYFMTILEAVSIRSTCPRRAVGAVLVDAKGRILATGYNGVPRGFEHCIDKPCAGSADVAGDTSKCMAIHAEVNAILQCSEIDNATSLYVSCTPCFQCAKIIANTNIKHIFVLQDYVDPAGKQVLQQAEIVLMQYDMATESYRFLK